MEKYRKFADETNGLNPFINAPKIKNRSSIISILRLPLYIISVIKAILIIWLYFQHAINQMLIQLVFIASLRRNLEKLFSFIYNGIILILLGVYTYSPIKGSMKENEFNKKTFILSSQSCIIDWICLLYFYTPNIVMKIANKDGLNETLVKIPYISAFKFIVGNYYLTANTQKELDELKKKYSEFKISEFMNNSDLTPILFFPENMKTTRECALNIRSNIVTELVKNFSEKKLDIICHISIYNYTYFCPNNTTDVLGAKNLIEICSQVYNSVSYQYSVLNRSNFNILDVDKKILNQFKTNEDYIDSLIQENLTHPEFRNNRVSLSCINGLEFLDFYEQSMSKEYLKKVD